MNLRDRLNAVITHPLFDPLHSLQEELDRDVLVIPLNESPTLAQQTEIVTQTVTWTRQLVSDPDTVTCTNGTHIVTVAYYKGCEESVLHLLDNILGYMTHIHDLRP
jgi:hypothetical protein